MIIHSTDSDSDSVVQEKLDKTIQEIGVYRFVGRINSGLIDATEGYDAVSRAIAHDDRRPLLSRLSHALLGRIDTFDGKGR